MINLAAALHALALNAATLNLTWHASTAHKHLDKPRARLVVEHRYLTSARTLVSTDDHWGARI